MLELTVTAYTRLDQVQARQNFSMERGGKHEVPALAEEVLSIYRCGERESPSSLRKYLLGRTTTLQLKVT